MSTKYIISLIGLYVGMFSIFHSNIDAYTIDYWFRLLGIILTLTSYSQIHYITKKS